MPKQASKTKDNGAAAVPLAEQLQRKDALISDLRREIGEKREDAARLYDRIDQLESANNATARENRDLLAENRELRIDNNEQKMARAAVEARLQRALGFIEALKGAERPGDRIHAAGAFDHDVAAAARRTLGGGPMQKTESF